MNLLGTEIFWIVLGQLVILLVLVNLLGRKIIRLLPNTICQQGIEYLSPVVGLATLTIVATYLGWSASLRDHTVFTGAVILLLAISLPMSKYEMMEVLRHQMTVIFFGVLAGASVLAPLFLWGAIDTHNDTFTYLAHANWLQHGFFSKSIPLDDVTPATTQVSLYQLNDFRMGGSFLLAFAQKVFGVENALYVYPAVLIVAVFSCVMAMGFVLSNELEFLSLFRKYALLVLPAFSVGGLVFAGNFGFYPQSLGVTFGAAGLFLVGPLIGSLVESPESSWFLAKRTIPLAILLAGAVFAYSEFTPFLGLTMVLFGVLVAALTRSYLRVFICTLQTVLITSVLLNVELTRTYKAIKTQSQAVVGNPVDWSVYGFIAHALGFHGGPYDLFQWNIRERNAAIAIPLVLLVVVGTPIFLKWQWKYVSQKRVIVSLAPPAIILAIFSAGLVFFRYLVESPFTVGRGQSWSQFKLADWAHPFASVILLFVVLVSFRAKGWQRYSIPTIFVTALVGACFMGLLRTKRIVDYYGVSNVAQFYEDFRRVALGQCPKDGTFYLALGGQFNKFRQIASLLLSDQKIKADWTGDDYIYALLPDFSRVEQPAVGDCVIAPFERVSFDKNAAAKVGRFSVERLSRVDAALVRVHGGYPREFDQTGWWHWFTNKIRFEISASALPDGDGLSTLARFEFGTKGTVGMVVEIGMRNGRVLRYPPVEVNGTGVFEKLISIPTSDVAFISIEALGIPSVLSEVDSRRATMFVKNLTFGVDSN